MPKPLDNVLKDHSLYRHSDVDKVSNTLIPKELALSTALPYSDDLLS